MRSPRSGAVCGAASLRRRDGDGTISVQTRDDSLDTVTSGGAHAPLGACGGTIAGVAVTDDKPVAEQLSELGAQLAWVRDYL
jgi:hypothetical protein